jgi:hypothetical protein
LTATFGTVRLRGGAVTGDELLKDPHQLEDSGEFAGFRISPRSNGPGQTIVGSARYVHDELNLQCRPFLFGEEGEDRTKAVRSP